MKTTSEETSQKDDSFIPYCRLVDQAGFTYKYPHREICWEAGKTVYPIGAEVIFFYHNPTLAVFLNPGYDGIENPRMFEVDPCGKAGTNGQWCRTNEGLRVIREVSCPELTPEQRTEIAIRFVLGLPAPSEKWRNWAEKWLSGEDRSAEAAEEGGGALTGYSTEHSADVPPEVYAAEAARAVVKGVTGEASILAILAVIKGGLDICTLQLFLYACHKATGK